MKFVDGVGLHWYYDNDVDVETMELLDYKDKDVFRLSTESCKYFDLILRRIHENKDCYIYIPIYIECVRKF